MSDSTLHLPVSKMAESLIGSEIIRLANEVNERIRSGIPVANLTIGDFDPAVFPVPAALVEEIIKAYQNGHTNYPMANGVPELRQAVSQWIKQEQNLDYQPCEILIAGGARPLIYALYKTVLNPGDRVLYPVPSWNNNHYIHLAEATGHAVMTLPEYHFMPRAEELRPHLSGVRLLALCSPQNPTGTLFRKEELLEIAQMVLDENKKRTKAEGPLYVLYDQIYAALTYGSHRHYDPVSLVPELRPYTVFVDGISKCLSATGIRVGWAFGPTHITDRMKSILGHIGAWAPKAEQVAVASYMGRREEVGRWLNGFKAELEFRLHAFYEGFKRMEEEGLPVHCIEPMAAMYLTVSFPLIGRQSGDTLIRNSQDITAFILNKALMALVPFSAFGAGNDSEWFRLSVGTTRKEDIPVYLGRLEAALKEISRVSV